MRTNKFWLVRMHKCVEALESAEADIAAKRAAFVELSTIRIQHWREVKVAFDDIVYGGKYRYQGQLVQGTLRTPAVEMAKNMLRVDQLLVDYQIVEAE